MAKAPVEDAVTLRPPAPRAALVTGASSGIGRAIALALAADGAALCLVGRNRERLAECEREARRLGARAVAGVVADLADEAALREAAAAARHFAEIDILVHAAAEHSRGPVETAPAAAFDRQYRTNLRAPYLLTQLLLPALRARGGDVVFVNSTQGVTAGPEVSQYAATKHGLAAFADSLRAEVNASGARVLTLYLGRTASAMQERIVAEEGRPYRPEKLLQPEDVAAMVMAALRLPRRAEVVSLALRPAEKSY